MKKIEVFEKEVTYCDLCESPPDKAESSCHICGKDICGEHRAISLPDYHSAYNAVHHSLDICEKCFPFLEEASSEISDVNDRALAQFELIFERWRGRIKR